MLSLKKLLLLALLATTLMAAVAEDPDSDQEQININISVITPAGADLTPVGQAIAEDLDGDSARRGRKGRMLTIKTRELQTINVYILDHGVNGPNDVECDFVLKSLGYTHCTIFQLWYVAIMVKVGGPDGVNWIGTAFDDLHEEVQKIAIAELDVFKEAEDMTYDDVDVDITRRMAGMGDPHFKGFSGQWFDYHGECDLVLLEIPSFDGDKDLTVHARTTIRYHYSYISGVAVQLGDDVLEVASYGEYSLNGVESARLGDSAFAGHHVVHEVIDEKTNKFTLHLNGRSFTVKTFKDLVAMDIDEVAANANVSGLLGNAKHGKLYGRDGETVFTDVNEYGQEWQVRDTDSQLFRVARAPQYPTEQCRLPKVDAAEKQRRLGEGLAREKAQIACGRFSGAEFDNCVFDVMAVGDVDIAQVGAF
jgi:hypothetical protein